MQLNRVTRSTVRTHEGAPAKRQSSEAQLARSVMACMLWEKEFYEDGETIAERIKALIEKVPTEYVTRMAVDARTKMNLRHAPLYIAVCMAHSTKHRQAVRALLPQIILRADELTEFLAMYWKDGRCKIARQVKRGLADAFPKFNEYQLGKYNRLDKDVKLRDVLFLAHPKPQTKAQQAVWNRLVKGTLKTPDTWEVALSAGKDKKATWKRLIKQEKLGGLALLRNLRNMQEAKVPDDTIREAIAAMSTERIMPYRFIAAARYAPQFEPELEKAMMSSLSEAPKLKGRTILLVDVSGSMDEKLSAKSDMKRIDAACGLAILLREVADVEVITFSNGVVLCPPRRGFALRDCIIGSQPHGGTALGAAVAVCKERKHDRLIVLTDEQSHDSVSAPAQAQSYMINVASAQNGIGYGPWCRITGWSESVIDYIRQYEEAI